MEQLEIGIIFREVQNLRSSIFLYSVLCPAVLLWSIEIYNLVFGKPAWSYNISNVYLFMLWIIYGAFFPLLFYVIKYITEVRIDGIYTRLIPFNPSFKKIPFYMIEECKIKVYDPFTGKDMEVKASKRGNLVIMLKLISGKQMMINSRKPEELYRAITQAAAQYK